MATDQAPEEFGSYADQPGYPSIRSGLARLAQADIRVAHNGHDFDERVVRKIYPDWKPKPGSAALDTLLISRLIFPTIFKRGPNTHLCPPKFRTRHSIEAWGYRLSEHKGAFDGGDWQTWSPEMQTYMNQDVKTLKRLWNYLMRVCKPAPRAVTLEHSFANIIRRQEAWGFTFDHTKATQLSIDIQTRSAVLEAELVEFYGEWWEQGSAKTIPCTRTVKMIGFPNITRKRFGKTGKELRPYVGPPEITYEEGASYTPIKRVLFSPSSREHVRKMLYQRHGWKPTKFTDKGAPMVDDEVLRQLPYPEAAKLADYYTLDKVGGYVSAGKKAWLTTCVREDDSWRQHGRVNTIGTYTFRCSHSDPNLGQVPTRSPEFGHRCRELFIARLGFILVGFDGSGLQLRLLAHYLHKYDGGEFAKVVTESDPHAWLRDTIGVDILGEGLEGRDKGKRINYALPFGAGALRLGSIASPHSPEALRKRIGSSIAERLEERFSAVKSLKEALKEFIQEHRYVPGLDGRKAPCDKPHTGLSTLLQMAEAVVMRTALVWLDNQLQAEGLRPGVHADGSVHPETADYEFTANVHDEAQADVRKIIYPTYEKYALQCVRVAGEMLKLKCPLKSDVKAGASWADTH